MSEMSAEQSANDVYFGSEALNRVSFLREDPDFITNTLLHPSTRFIFFENSNPLVLKKDDGKLVILTNGSWQLKYMRKGLLLSETWRNTLEEWSKDNREQSKDIRQNKASFVFLGLEDESVGLNLLALKATEDTEDGSEKFLDFQGRYQGIPYYAVDLTGIQTLRSAILDLAMENLDASPDMLIFTHSRKHFFSFTPKDAALYSHGKMFLDWLHRNRFCPGCGSTVVPIHAGGKLKCTNEQENKSEDGHLCFICPVRSATVSNVSFPRTDTVVITAVTNPERSKVLLSLNKRHVQSKMYSCTAGFIEPSETIEVATKREIWEETGVVCSSVNIICSQPWPYPSNLMIGCVAVVEFNGINEIIRLDHDKELADAKWFDTEFVKSLMPESEELLPNPDGILLPLAASISFQLLKTVVDQYASSKLNINNNKL